MSHLQTYDQEMANIERLFSGDDGVGPTDEPVPGVGGIDLDL